MTKWVRPLALIVFCLISLAFAGPVNAAACAMDLGGNMDSPTIVQSVSADDTDCDMGQNKVHRCSHDACCGYYLAISEIRDFSTLPPPGAATIAPVTKHLTASGWEPLLDPPRA